MTQTHIRVFQHTLFLSGVLAALSVSLAAIDWHKTPAHVPLWWNLHGTLTLLRHHLLLLFLLIPISFLLALEEFLVVFAPVNNDHADVQLDGFHEKHSCNRELGVGDSFVKVCGERNAQLG